jgi:hypothetical protein
MPWILYDHISDILMANVTIQVELCFNGKPCDIQDTRSVLNNTSEVPGKSVMSRYSIFRHWLTLPLSVRERQILHAELVATPIWCARILLTPELHRLPSYEQIRYVYVPSHVYDTQTPCFFRIFQQSGRQCLRRCNASRKLLTILSLHSNTSTRRTVQGFDVKHFFIRRVRCHLPT